MQERQSAETLLIDPNPDDIERFLDALEDEKIANNVHTVTSGVDALDYLHQRGDYSDAPQPNLILLDIDLPAIDGHELLKTLNNDSGLAEIPVIILTAGDDDEAVADLYDLHVNAYIRKPVDPDEFLEVVRRLEDFWLEVVWLPSTDRDE